MRLAVLIVLLFSASASASPFDAVEPAKSAFTYHAPKGFSPLTEAKLPDDCLAAFTEDGEKAPVTLYVFESARTLNQRDLFEPKTDLGDGFPSVFRENWQGVYIFGVRHVTGPDEALLVRLRLYVPLIDRTIWLQAESRVTRELDALIALRQTLDTCRGQTNWQKDSPPNTGSREIYTPRIVYGEPGSWREPVIPSQHSVPEGLAIRSSINSLFWASLVCALPFALAWGVWMLRRRPQTGFKATSRPLFNEPKGWGGPVPHP